MAAQALRHRVQPRQHRPRRRALAGDAAPRPALGHRRALRAWAARIDGSRRGARSARRTRRARTSQATADPLARVVFALLVARLLRRVLPHPAPEAHADRRCSASSCTPTFSPDPARREARQEAISFKLAQADAVTVTIIDAQGNDVATLVARLPGAALQTVLAALERPPRRRARLQRADQRAPASTILVPRHHRPARAAAANTACASTCTARTAKCSRRAASRWCAR